MRSLRIAVATSCFGQPLKEAVRTAAEMGASGVQFDVGHELRPTDLSDTGRRQLLHYLDELNLAAASLRFTARRAFYDQQRLDERVDAVKVSLQLAFQLKCRVVTGRIGRVPADPASAEYRLLRDVLNDVARCSNRVGAVFAVTPSGDSADALARLLDAVTDGPMGVNFDPAIFIMHGQGPSDALRRLHTLVHHVQVRDAVREVDGTGVEVPVGRGEVEWDELLALLEETDYRGWLTVDRTQGEDKQADCARAVQYLQRVAAG